jgi:hypothetical protein
LPLRGCLLADNAGIDSSRCVLHGCSPLLGCSMSAAVYNSAYLHPA